MNMAFQLVPEIVEKEAEEISAQSQQGKLKRKT